MKEFTEIKDKSDNWFLKASIIINVVLFIALSIVGVHYTISACTQFNGYDIITALVYDSTFVFLCKKIYDNELKYYIEKIKPPKKVLTWFVYAMALYAIIISITCAVLFIWQINK
jgi:hypothetical protein